MSWTRGTILQLLTPRNLFKLLVRALSSGDKNVKNQHLPKKFTLMPHFPNFSLDFRQWGLQPMAGRLSHLWRRPANQKSPSGFLVYSALSAAKVISEFINVAERGINHFPGRDVDSLNVGSDFFSALIVVCFCIGFIKLRRARLWCFLFSLKFTCTNEKVQFLKGLMDLDR